MAPIKTILVRSKYAPWLSNSTKKLMAQITATQTKDIDDWRLYKSLRNTATSRMRQKRKLRRRWSSAAPSIALAHCGKNVKTWLNWNNSGPPSQLFHNGMLVSSPAGLARTMNKFFIDKVTRRINGIPASNNDPLAKLKVQVSHHVESCQGCPNSEERWHTCTQELQTSSPLASVQQDIGENSVQPVSEVLGWSEAHTLGRVNFFLKKH